MRISDWSSDVCSSDLGKASLIFSAYSGGWALIFFSSSSPNTDALLTQPAGRLRSSSRPFHRGRHPPSSPRDPSGIGIRLKSYCPPPAHRRRNSPATTALPRLRWCPTPPRPVPPPPPHPPP